MKKVIVLLISIGAATLLSQPATSPLHPPSATAQARQVPLIVQSSSLPLAAAAVEQAGGTVTRRLGIVSGVAARLPSAALATLRADRRVTRVSADRAVEAASFNFSNHPGSGLVEQLGADLAHQAGITGRGVTVAVVDTGFLNRSVLRENTAGETRLLAHYNAITDRTLGDWTSDVNGHGAHVSAIALSSAEADGGGYNGIAPDADLVAVKAFDYAGRGTYSSVIRGLDWIWTYHQTYGIRVVNLSFGAPQTSHYWDDPLAQAVTRLWQAGLVVITAAGNGGPDPMTVTVPGNVPYVVTVGAMTDAYTAAQDDDRLATFSSAGPTPEGFVKPEVVAPGGHVLSLMKYFATIALSYPDYRDPDSEYYTMSGTSQATAAVSGIAALLLEAHPELGPDEVKCRLLAGARPATRDNALAYSPFQQGAGLVDAWAALQETRGDCANRGLDIELDLAGVDHFFGPARLDGAGQFVIDGTEHSWNGTFETDTPYAWNGGDPWTDGSTWSQGNPWVDAGLWSTGNPWIDIGGNPWIDIGGNPWIDAADWWGESDEWDDDDTDSRAMTIFSWVEQE